MQPTTDRASIPLTERESRVKAWIRANHGVLSRVAEECNVSVTFVNRIAYNRSAISKGGRVERALVARGCPLIQKF